MRGLRVRLPHRARCTGGVRLAVCVQARVIAVCLVAGSCATDGPDPVAPELPRLRLSGVALNDRAVDRAGCPFEPCPEEAPTCVDSRGFSSGCGGAAVVPCDQCGFMQVPMASDECGNCECALDCRVPFASRAGDWRCDWGTGQWRRKNCLEGASCRHSEVCSDDGRCIPAVCDTDLDCARGDICSSGRCTIYYASSCAASFPEQPP
jgi:hypothetical protein